MKKIGLSKTAPENPASYKHQFKAMSAGAGVDVKRKVPPAKPAVNYEDSFLQEAVDSRPLPEVESTESTEAQASQQKDSTVNLTFKNLNKKGTQAIYTGGRTTQRFAVANFPDKVPPPTLDVSGILGPVEKVAKVKLTKEERAALPKPTAAEALEQFNARAEKRRAKLEAAAQAELQPAL